VWQNEWWQGSNCCASRRQCKMAVVAKIGVTFNWR